MVELVDQRAARIKIVFFDKTFAIDILSSSTLLMIGSFAHHKTLCTLFPFFQIVSNAHLLWMVQKKKRDSHEHQ